MFAPAPKNDFYLFQRGQFNPYLLSKIMSNSVQHGTVLVYLMGKLRPHNDVLRAITHEFDAEWYKGLINRPQASIVLGQMVHANILRKVLPSQKCREYYVNPEIFHTLTKQQRLEYRDNHDGMFMPIVLSDALPSEIQTPP